LRPSFARFYCTLFWTEKVLNHCDFTDIVSEMKISNFCVLVWGVIFVPFSEKVTYNFGSGLFKLGLRKLLGFFFEKGVVKENFDIF